MHPNIARELAEQRMEDLRRAASESRRDRPSRTVRVDREVVLRGARGSDGQAIATLAALDGALPPLGPALVAEVGGTIAAVLPLGGGPAFSDPFRPTLDLLALLEARAQQLERARQAARRRTRFGWHALAALRRLV